MHIRSAERVLFVMQVYKQRDEGFMQIISLWVNHKLHTFVFTMPCPRLRFAIRMPIISSP